MTDLKIEMREMRSGEERELWRLFHASIHQLASAHYSAAQLAAWSPMETDMEESDWQAWCQRMRAVAPIIAHHQDQVVGFSDLQADGLIDFMFVHPDWSGCGVARRLMEEIVRRARFENITELHAYVSVTAQPFFAHSGFVLVQQRTVVNRGVTMHNALMQRRLA